MGRKERRARSLAFRAARKRARAIIRQGPDGSLKNPWLLQGLTFHRRRRMMIPIAEWVGAPVETTEFGPDGMARFSKLMKNVTRIVIQGDTVQVWGETAEDGQVVRIQNDVTFRIEGKTEEGSDEAGD